MLSWNKLIINIVNMDRQLPPPARSMDGSAGRWWCAPPELYKQGKMDGILFLYTGHFKNVLHFLSFFPEIDLPYYVLSSMSKSVI